MCEKKKYEFIKLTRNNGIASAIWLNIETGEREYTTIGKILNPEAFMQQSIKVEEYRSYQKKCVHEEDAERLANQMRNFGYEAIVIKRNDGYFEPFFRNK